MTDKKPSKDNLIDFYWSQGLSLSEIGKKYDVTKGAVHRWMKKEEIPRRKPDHEKDGYIHFDKKGYLRFGTKVSGKDKKIRVHRLVAVAEYGLEAIHKHVHHRNNVRWDNRPSNLEVLSHSEHSSLHAQETIQKDNDFGETQHL